MLEDERADAGLEGQTCLARPNSQARTGTGKTYFPCSNDHEQDWQQLPVDAYSAIHPKTYRANDMRVDGRISYGANADVMHFSEILKLA